MDYLIVGLGNIGSEYQGTRHNIGFEFLDYLLTGSDVAFREKKEFKGSFCLFRLKNIRLGLLKPTTYMNMSGEAVIRVSNFYKIPPEKIFVVVDDLDLPFGTIRLRAKGGNGGHNGLKSVQECLGSPFFNRLRIGILTDELREKKRLSGSNQCVTSFVLGRFSIEEKKTFDPLFELVLKTLKDYFYKPIGITASLSVLEQKNNSESE